MNSKKPQLLAPAGSLEAFFAALESGADAVYCGLKAFSARARAKNFSLTDMQQMTATAHRENKQLLVTVNTLVKQKELSALVHLLGELEAMQVDGVILQDLGVWQIARQHFPGLNLHASTQMTVHNTAGVKQLERMGFTRAVLARELTLDEITQIRRQTTIELEHFIHGALCFSFSGQCYFSSWLGGKSGNRGRCAQPCRRRFNYRNKPGYYFSTSDLSAIDLLPEMATAGIGTLKIEGRMKSAEYVANVVSAYRMALDAPAGRRRDVVKEAKEKLKASFGRTPTRGFLAGTEPTDIAIPSQKGATGRFMGTVEWERDGHIRFKTRDRLHVGDRLRIQPKTDRAGTGFTVRDLKMGPRSVKKVQAGQTVTVPSTFRRTFHKGDSVYKVSSEQAFTLSEAACRKRLASTKTTRRAALSLTVEVQPDQLTLRGAVGRVEQSQTYEIDSFPAEDRGLDRAILQKTFGATGDQPFRLDRLIADNLPPIVIPPSRLKAIRREYYADLAKQVKEDQGQGQQQRIHQALTEVAPVAHPGAAPSTLCLVGHARDAHVLEHPEVDRIGLPLTPANLQEMPALRRKLKKRSEALVWDLPFILFDNRWEWMQQAVQQLVQEGFRHFRVNNLGHLPLFDGLEDLQLMSGYRLFTLNSAAVSALHALNLQETTLYLEDDRDNLTDMAQSGGAQNLIVYTNVPMMTSRIKVRNVRADTPVVADSGDGYRVIHQDGLMWLRPDTDFSLIGRLDELRQRGLHLWTLDLSHCGPFSPTGKAALDGLRYDRSITGTRAFNYEQGLE